MSRQLIAAETAVQPTVQVGRAVQEGGSVAARGESPLAESGGYTVGDLKKFTGATNAKAAEYCQRMIADGCTVELIVGGLSVTGNNAALEEMYGPGNTAMIWGNATTGNNLFATAKKHRHAIVLVTNPTSWNACFAATPDSAEKVIRKLTARSSKDAVDESGNSIAVTEANSAEELTSIPGNLDYGANQFISALWRAGAKVKLVRMPDGITTYQLKKAAGAVYGKDRAPILLSAADTKLMQSVKGQTARVFLTYHPPHDAYASAVIVTDDSLDKIMRKISAAQTVQEAGQAVEIDYPPFSASSSGTRMLGDLWAVNSRVKFGLTGLATNQCADKLSRVYGAENVEITLDRLITRRDPRAVSFVLRATGKQVWMLFAAGYSPVCVSVITDDDFGKIMRKIAVAGSVSESKPILKKIKTKVRDVNKDQLKIGRKVEREHTNNPMTATKIALAHLGEDPKYYDKLDKAGLIDEARLPVPNTDGPTSANELENLLSAYTPRMRADLRRVFSVAKSVRIVGRDDLSSSVVQAARAAYGRAAAVIPVIDGVVSVDASVIGSFTGKDVVVMVAINAQTGMVRVWRPLVLMVTQDSAEKIDRTITKWLSVKESLSAPDQIAESFAMAPTTWAATVRPLTAKLRAELDDIVLRADKTTYLGVVGTRLTDSLLHRADKIYGDSNVTVLSLDGWANGGFLERVEDKNIAVISNLNPLWPKMVIVITDDSPEKIARKFAAQGAQMESARLTESIKLTPVPPKVAKFAYDPITDTIMHLREVGAKLSFVAVSGDHQHIARGTATGLAMAAGYDVGQANYQHQPSEQFILDCAGQNVVVVYRPNLGAGTSPLYVTFIRTDDSPEKIERALNRALTVAESALVPDPAKA